MFFLTVSWESVKEKSSAWKPVEKVDYGQVHWDKKAKSNRNEYFSRFSRSLLLFRVDSIHLVNILIINWLSQLQKIEIFYAFHANVAGTELFLFQHQFIIIWIIII